MAEGLLRLSHYAASCFHSQQAGEKALLYSVHTEARGHSIMGLLSIYNNVTGNDVDEVADDSRFLDSSSATAG